MTETHAQILVIDEEGHQLDTICRGLLLYGYGCEAVPSAQAALRALGDDEGHGFDLVLAELSTLGRAGLERIERIHEKWPDLPIVVITGLIATRDAEAIRQRRISLLTKPFGPETLDTALQRALGLS